MIAPVAPPRAEPPWYARPAIVLPIVAALIVLTALATPTAVTGRGGDARLSTYSADPQGGRLLFQLAQRLGWRADQARTEAIAADSDAIIAELDPVMPLRTTETHELLEHVRRGGALLVMLGDGVHALADSLSAATGLIGTIIRVPSRDAGTCPADSVKSLARRYVYTLWPGDVVTMTPLRWRGPPPGVLVPLVESEGPGSRRQTVAAGFEYGRGRIVVSADPDVLRNDAIRVCKYGLDVSAVRMLEFLGERGDHPRRHIVFDEFRQGYGQQNGTIGAITGYLVDVSSGRVLFQLLAAGLVLLVAVAPRTMPPRDSDRVERRSPLEHVDALGRAYAQVGATRSATARLVRGVRRRLAGGAMRSALDPSDDAFLDRALRDAPALHAEIAAIKSALRTPVSGREFAAVGAALEQLELSLSRT